MSLENWTYETNSANTRGLPIGDRTYREVQGYGYSQGQTASAKRLFLVDWNQQGLFLADLLGTSQIVGGALSRVIPDQHPDWPNLFCVNATVEPFGVNTNPGPLAGTWQAAQVEATYAPLKYAVLRDDQVNFEIDRYVIRQCKGRAEYITTQSNFKYVTSGTILAANPGFVQPSLVVSYTWVGVPSSTPLTPPNLATILFLQGKTNIDFFDGFYPGTVLFFDYNIEQRDTQLDGTVLWDITYIMFVRDYGPSIYGSDVRIGVNFTLDLSVPGGGLYDIATAGPEAGTLTGNPIYQYGDLNQLFVLSS